MNRVLTYIFQIHIEYPQPQLAVIVLKIVKRVVIHIIFTLYSRNVRLQHVPGSQLSTNKNECMDRSESRSYGNDCYAVGDGASVSVRLRSCWR